MKIITIQGVECAEIEYDDTNYLVLGQYVREVSDGGFSTGCGLCPNLAGVESRLPNVCGHCANYYIPMQHIPILIMRGLKV